MKTENFKNKEVLGNLYWDRKLSTFQIATKFKISDETVRYWMHKNGVERRKHKYNVTKKQLLDLYVKKKLTLEQVAKKLGIKNHSTVAELMMKYGIKTRSISEIKTKYKRANFSGNLTEKSYLLGLRTGDLSCLKNFYKIRVQTATTHPAQVKMMQDVFGKYSHVHVFVHKDKRGINEWHVYSDLDESFEFLVPKLEEIPGWILKNDNFFFSFLAGYADAEGSFDVFENTDNSISFHFRVASNDKIILQQMLTKLKSLEFSCGFYMHAKKGQKATYGIYSKNVYALRMFRKSDVFKLVEKLKNYSRHDEKIKRMKLIQDLKTETKWNKIKDQVLSLRKEIMNSRLQQNI